jgi:hypothetical protein
LGGGKIGPILRHYHRIHLRGLARITSDLIMADSPARFQPMTGEKPTQFRYIIYSVGTYTSYVTQTLSRGEFWASYPDIPYVTKLRRLKLFTWRQDHALKGYFSVSQPLLHGGALKIIFRIPRNAQPMKTKTNKKVVGSAHIFFHYFQLQNKTFRDISRSIWNLSRYSKIFISSAIYCGNPKEGVRKPDWEIV